MNCDSMLLYLFPQLKVREVAYGSVWDERVRPQSPETSGVSILLHPIPSFSIFPQSLTATGEMTSF